jgi:hypothetical protein
MRIILLIILVLAVVYLFGIINLRMGYKKVL